MALTVGNPSWPIHVLCDGKMVTTVLEILRDDLASRGEAETLDVSDPASAPGESAPSASATDPDGDVTDSQGLVDSATCLDDLAKAEPLPHGVHWAGSKKSYLAKKFQDASVEQNTKIKLPVPFNVRVRYRNQLADEVEQQRKRAIRLHRTGVVLYNPVDLGLATTDA